MNNWPGILRVDEFQIHTDGKLVYEEKDLYNVIHLDGQKLILETMFTTYTPQNIFYVGLDERSILSQSQNMSSVTGEPVGNGYQRQGLNRAGGFTIIESTPVKAQSNLIAFSGTGAGWGPVKNIFLCTTPSGNSGALISSVVFRSSGITVAGNSVVSMRFSMLLGAC
jgi:hypothetical protein